MNFPRLATHLFDLLWEHVAAARDPDFVVGADNPGGPYLRRWFLIPRNRVFNLYLHQFLRDDDDRALHDHPWWSASLILDGGYIEHTIQRGGIHRREFMDVGRLRVMRASHAHRVELVRWADPNPDPCDKYRGDDDPPSASFSLQPPVRAWTLFITGPRIRRWGFHCKDAGWIDYERFTKPGSTGETGAGCDA